MNEEKYVEMLENGELYDYITNLQQENEKLKMRNDMLRKDIDSFVNDNKVDYKSRCEKAVEILGRYKHLSSPTEEQAIEQEEIVENAYDILNGRSE